MWRLSPLSRLAPLATLSLKGRGVHVCAFPRIRQAIATNHTPSPLEGEGRTGRFAPDGERGLEPTHTHHLRPDALVGRVERGPRLTHRTSVGVWSPGTATTRRNYPGGSSRWPSAKG